MHISPDHIIFWENGIIKLNGTIVYTWALMLLLVIGSKVITAQLSRGRSRWQHLLETIMIFMQNQIREVGLHQPRTYLPFLGTLFVFVATASLLAIVPGYEPPTGSLSTTAALAICVFVAVPFYGIREQGLRRYMRSYLKPTPLLLPFNILAELTRTLALAVRLFGNMMSGTMILAILLVITPFIFPVVMGALDLLTGMVQAYIFGILATIYIAAATSDEAEDAEIPERADHGSEGDGQRTSASGEQTSKHTS
ncbi:MAG TPA: F0F1 ATP synthase subunit A [Nitrosospira sp.]|nr:F0F1 ATP synthase subunit A [Nitrosospira sp.]